MTSRRPGKLSIDLAGIVCVDGARFVRSGEETKVDVSSVSPDLRLPLSVLCAGDALYGAPVPRTSVGVVLGWRSLAEITESIIEAIAIDMVDLMQRPSAVNKEPNQSMDGERPSTESHKISGPVSMGSESPYIASVKTPVAAIRPNHPPAVGIV